MWKKCRLSNYFWLGLIMILALVLRFYRISFPLADWHSWRQADTSAVSRNFVKKGYDLLRPRYDDLSKLNSGFKNPEGYRFVEFPLYNLFQALAFQLWPALGLEVWGRLVSIFFSLGSLIFLYLIVRRHLGERLGLWTAFFWAVLPFNVYYSRVILPEPLSIFATLGMIYFFDPPAGGFTNHWPLVIATVFATTAFLVKPFALVFLLPIVYLAWRKWRFNWRAWWPLLLCWLVSLLPFAAWRLWMRQYPEGIPDPEWVFNAANIRFKGAWFWWLFGERIGKLILGGWSLIFLGLGMVAKPQKEGWFFHTWLLAILAYFSIVASGNVYHDYYQTLAVPTLSVFLAKGADFLLAAPKKVSNKAMSYLLLAISLFFSLAFSWYQVRDFFNINNPAIVEAGRVLDKIAPDDARVIAPYGGDTAFLYQTNRQGWPIKVPFSLLSQYDAQYYVTLDLGPETQEIISNYCLEKKTDTWAIINLTKTCPSRL